jgi:O-antigen/teichoic acid export membrane protein
MSILSSISVALLGKGLSAFVTLIGTMIIARLLTPNELGAFSIAMAVTAFLTALRNFGTSNYLVQASEIDQDVVGSAFTATALISWSLGTLLLLSRYSIANFFGAPEIAPIMALLALNFVVSPFVMTAAALMMREHRFPELVRSEVTAGILGVCASVGLCLMGASSISLALGMTVQSLTLLSILLYLRPKHFTCQPRTKYAPKVLRFGGWASGITLLNQVTSRAPEIVLGRSAGVATAALFDRGAALTRLVEDQVYAEVVRVLLPAFAEEHRARPGDPGHYLSRLGFAMSVLAPLLLFLAVFADSAIALLYGDQWGDAVAAGVLVAIAGAVLLPFAICEQMLIGIGAVRTVARIKAIQALILLAGLLFVPVWGLEAAGVAVLVSTIGYVIVSQAAVMQRLAFGVGQLAAALEKPLTAVLLTFVGTTIADHLSAYSPERQPFQHLLLGALCTGAAWVLAVKLLRLPAYGVLKKGTVMIVRTIRHRSLATPA